MTPAPIVLFAYKRLDTLQRVIAALERAELAAESKLYIFVDGAKKESDAEKNNAVKAYLKSWEQQAVFKSVTLRFSDTNKGLSESIIGGVGQIMREHGKAIVIEDDIVVAKDFLSFMNRALEYYEKDAHVWAITGYTENLEMLRKREYSTFPWYRCDCWGWASWRDRWDTVDWEVKDYRQFIFSHKERKKMNRGGEDMARMLDAQMAGAIDSWAIRWGYSACKADRVIIHPTVSRVMNVGFDGEGSNCGDGRISEPLAEMTTECRLLPSDGPEKDLHRAYLRRVNHQYGSAARIRKRLKSLGRRMRWMLSERQQAE